MHYTCISSLKSFSFVSLHFTWVILTVPLTLSQNSEEHLTQSQFTSQNVTTETPGSTDLSNETAQPQDEENPMWMIVFDKSQLVMVLIGLVANTVTLATLIKHSTLFSPAILTLLRHQSVVDACICLIGALTLIWPFMWVTGNWVIDLLVCHVWHSQAAYWLFVIVSIYNLVAIAFERYLAVCHPFKHSGLTRRQLYIFSAFCYLFSGFTMIGSFLQVKIENGVCVFDHYITGSVGKRFFAFYGIYGFLVAYLIPCILFIVLYGKVIFTFKKRQRDGQFSTNRLIDKATAELTKTAVVVTCIFIVAIGYDLWYYILARLGLVVYEQYSLIQKVGVWLSAFNSVANPFVYALLMPAFRRSVYTLICSRCMKTENLDQKTTSFNSIASVKTVSENASTI